MEPKVPTPVFSFPGFVCRFSAQGFCTGVGETLCKFLGFAETQLLGSGWKQVAPPSLHDRLPFVFQRFKAGRKRLRGRIALLTRGESHALRFEAAQCASSEAADSEIWIQFERVSRKHAHPVSHGAEDSQLALYFRHAPVGIGFLGPDLSFRQANPVLGRTLNLGGRSPEGLPLRQALRSEPNPASAHEIERVCLNTLQTGKPHALQGWPSGADSSGLPRFADWEIRRIESKNHTPLGLLVTVSDVTRQKYVEEKVRLLASVLEVTPDLVAVFSPEGRVLYLNRSAQQAAGLPEGTPVHTLHFSDLQPEWASRLLFESGFPTALRTGIWEGETAFRLASGNDIPVSQILCAHANNLGQVEFLSSILRDITESRQYQDDLAKAQEGLEQRVAERTAALAEASALIRDRVLQQAAVAELGEKALSGLEIPSLLQDSTRAIVQILRVDFCAVRELSTDETVLEQRAHTGTTTADSVSVAQRIPAGTGSPSGYSVSTGAPVVFEKLQGETRFEINEWLLKSGFVSGMAVPISINGKPFGALSVFTKAPRTFGENDTHFLQSVANILAAAIHRQRVEAGIQQALEEARTANRAKSAFLSRMSHELRTPLNAILGFTQLLKMEDPTPGQLESIAHVSRAGQHLLSLINEVLDISQIEAGRVALTLDSVELNEFLRNCVELMRPLAARNSLRLEFIARDKRIYVRADRQRLKQVALNLLSNAIKYNNKEGDVVVSLRTLQEGARMEVRDTGPGIPPQKRSLLFKPFERLGAEDSGVEGAGIGLALSKGFVEAMGGSIGVESAEGAGCVFWAQLPLAKPSDQPELSISSLPPELAPTPLSPARTKLLYIESHDLDLQLMEHALLKHPRYHLLTAMQGSIGLELAREHRPEAILIDLQLPDLAATNLMARIRQDPALRQTPVILLAADGDSPALQILARKYSASMLLKPYSPRELIQCLERALAPLAGSN